MDIQLKRGLLDVCVLSAIKDGESYGYKIIEDMKPYLEMSESISSTTLVVAGIAILRLFACKGITNGALCLTKNIARVLKSFAKQEKIR